MSSIGKSVVVSVMCAHVILDDALLSLAKTSNGGDGCEGEVTGQCSDQHTRKRRRRREVSEGVERGVSMLHKVVGSSDGLLLNLEAESLWEGLACVNSTHHWMAVQHLCQRLYQVCVRGGGGGGGGNGEERESVCVWWHELELHLVLQTSQISCIIQEIV